MNVGADNDLLVELLDRQFEFLLGLGGTSQIIRLSRILMFLRNEPQIAMILEDLRIEGDEDLRQYERDDSDFRQQIRELWDQHEPEIRARLKGVSDEERDELGDMDRFASELAARPPAKFNPRTDIFERTTAALIQTFRSWWSWSIDIRGNSSQPSGDYAKLGPLLDRVAARHAFIVRRLNEKSRALAWPAYERLLSHPAVTNPRPPAPDDDCGWMKFRIDSELADAIAKPDAERTGSHVGDIGKIYNSIGADAKTLYEELRLRVGLKRSRIALIRRYAARCEAFDAERLRTMCAQRTQRAEGQLTLDLARFLFDAGYTPLIDATTSGLRPDVLAVNTGALFYVEAKQYADKEPGSQLRKAYGQVWSTWSRLRKNYDVVEAFLVVFRRSGPLVELPPVIHHQGLRLYSVLADISSEAGSREKSKPIWLTEDEVRPQGNG